MQTSSMTPPTITIERRRPDQIILTAAGFSVDIFTNACGLCAWIKSDRHQPGETPLAEMFRSWDRPTTGDRQTSMTQTDLPPDPEGMNDTRAARAACCIQHFKCQRGTDWDDAVCDLLCDMMHFCDREGFDFGHELERACMHYEAETTDVAEIA